MVLAGAVLVALVAACPGRPDDRPGRERPTHAQPDADADPEPHAVAHPRTDADPATDPDAHPDARADPDTRAGAADR